MSNLWPLKDGLSTLSIAGRSCLEWVERGSLKQSQIDALRYPWQFLELHAELLEQAYLEQADRGGKSFEEGCVSPGAPFLGEGARLLVGEGTTVLPGVYVEGLVVVGEGCKIGPNCYLRGSISIGDHCHVGQAVELKNVILGNGTNVGHLSYIGDSVLGNKVNLGAGTITSNLRHDGKNHHSMVEGERVDTGRRKFGTIIGDSVHTGIHTSLYPGRKLGVGSMTRPGGIVNVDLADGEIK